MSHELSAAEVRAITRSAEPDARYRIDASFSIVVHDLEGLRAAARRAFDHGRFASEQERERSWAAIENDPGRLLSQAIDFARLTEDVPGILGHSVEFVVREGG